MWSWTSRAIAATVVPLAEAMMINARRTRIEPCLPRRTIRCSVCPSASVSRRTLTGSAIAPPTVAIDHLDADSTDDDQIASTKTHHAARSAHKPANVCGQRTSDAGM